VFNRGKKPRKKTEVDSSSMADIAFLLLIFFLVTTTIVNEKGVNFILPKKKEEVKIKPLKERNVFKVLINSNDKILVNDEPMELNEIRENAIKFLSNHNKNPKLSESPQKAVISYKTDRGTSYEIYLEVLDELSGAYHQLRADKLNISLKEYLYLEKDKDADRKLLKKAKDAYPKQLSEAEPTELGKY
jgi:biopolymer transport protein ExbD